MVGFGSSLRMARRPGWEGAYLDYETLKLMLSQIEAVYEEEGHRRQHRSVEVFISDEDGPGRNKRRELRDYRDELFQESDSEQAYLSPDEPMARDDKQTKVHHIEVETAQATPGQSFRLPYSHRLASKEEEEEEGEEDSFAETGCGAVVSGSLSSWTSAYYSSKKTDTSTFPHLELKSSSKKLLAVISSELEEDDRFFIHSQPDATNAFFLAGCDDDANQAVDFQKISIQSEPPQSLLKTQTVRVIDSASMTRTAVVREKPKDDPQTQERVPLVQTQTHEQQHRSKDAHRQGRRRERRVPRHLRIAHAKARAITERFLGLLRAETEKIVLFAQSRLGELADTAGSLRFPSFDDDYNSAHASQDDVRGTSYTYHLSDGGRHPSASSSSDEGAGRGGINTSWSDSSKEDDDSETRRQVNEPSIHQAFSGDAFLSSGNGRANGTARKKSALHHSGPVFQRSDHILGEDMLFLSAVEEADGFTAVGVGLLHVLRYIAVNLIAVRKICKKHDRLLMNRMLGGYYWRTSQHGVMHGSLSRTEELQTLGGLLARVAGDLYEAHPSLLGQIGQFKLVGVYDRKVQKLANSRTVQVVSSCLALALSEYEIARSRANALTKLDQDDASNNPPSTTSIVSLTRLRFTVLSIFALREAARFKMNFAASYLARSLLVQTGQSVVGEGLDGCSRPTLDFFVAFNPDAAVSLHTTVLFEGLKKGSWHEVAMSEAMITSLAASTTPDHLTNEVAVSMVSQEVTIVAQALSIVPESKSTVLKDFLKGRPQVRNFGGLPMSLPLEGLPVSSLSLSSSLAFLYTMNYFVVHGTADVLLRANGTDSSYAAIIIGAPNASAIVVAMIHFSLLAKDSSLADQQGRVRRYRTCLLSSAFTGIISNVIHIVAVDKRSVVIAIIGRLVLGLSFTDIVQRSIVTSCKPSYVVSEASLLMMRKISGMICGLVVGSTAELLAIMVRRLGINSLQSISWLMTVLWFFLLCRIFALFHGHPTEQQQTYSTDATVKSSQNASAMLLRQSSSSSSNSSNADSPTAARLFAYGSITDPLADDGGHSEVRDDQNQRTFFKGPVRSKTLWHQIKTSINRISKLLRSHFGLPVALYLTFYATFAIEITLTSSPIVTARYFGWSGAHAGAFLSFLAMTIIPINLFCEVIARRYEERTVIQRSLSIVGSGLFVTLNWTSLLSMASQVPKLLTDNAGRPDVTYDGKLGLYQYLIGCIASMFGLFALQGASLSLLSKVSPSEYRRVVVYVGSLTTILGLIARLLANAQVFLVSVSHLLIFTDDMNALVLPLLVACFLFALVVKKRFFFLM